MRYLMAMMLLLCVLALPVNAGDYVLHIFGNANLDGNIDEQDLVYLQGIIEGKELKTNLSDADSNGVVDQSDIAQVERIINGTQTEITIVDSDNKTVTVKGSTGDNLHNFKRQCLELACARWRF